MLFLPLFQYLRFVKNLFWRGKDKWFEFLTFENINIENIWEMKLSFKCKVALYKQKVSVSISRPILRTILFTPWNVRGVNLWYFPLVDVAWLVAWSYKAAHCCLSTRVNWARYCDQWGASPANQRPGMVTPDQSEDGAWQQPLDCVPVEIAGSHSAPAILAASE